MVRGVCRRVLRHAPDADDAFQATFLALVLKARSIRRRQALGGWLYQVAYRVSLRARAATARRTLYEHQVPPRIAVEPNADPEWKDLRPVLDEEISRLPEKYRAAVILCYLEGKTNQQAAEQLGWPRGTVAIRLRRARDLLRERLTRRGLALSVGLLSTVFAAEAKAHLPAALVNAALKAGLATDRASVVTPQVVALTKGVLQAMFLTRLKARAALVFLLLVLAAVAGVPAYRAQAVGPVDDPPGLPLPAVLSAEEGQARVEQPPLEQTFFEELTTEIDQSLNILGKTLSAHSQKQTQILRWTLGRADEDGNRPLLLKIEAIKLDLDIGGHKITYDSTKDANSPKNPTAEFYKALVGSQFELTVSPAFQIVKTEGREEFGRKLAAAVPNLGPTVKRVLNRESLQRMVDSVFLDMPRRALERGRSWTRQRKLNVGSAYHLNSTSTFRPGAVEGELDLIDVSTVITVPPEPDENADASIRITDAELDIHDGNGTISFDRRKGRIVRSSQEQRLQGTVTMVHDHSTAAYRLSQRERTTARTMDSNPLGQAKEEPKTGRSTAIEQKRQELERTRRELERLEELDRQQRQIQRLEQELEQNKREQQKLERELARLRKEYEQRKDGGP
jgi:RNA polymerase sigma factor (sigma-70 family)